MCSNLCSSSHCKEQTEKKGALFEKSKTVNPSEAVCGKRFSSLPKKTGIEISYGETTFKSMYQRNNKRGGLKNLRCFPSCGEQHKEFGFCGRAVTARVKHSKIKKSQSIIVRSEFVKAGFSGLVQRGDIVTSEFIASKDRSKACPTNPWLEGKLNENLSSETESVYEINRDRKGWHYGWQSNKHTCDTRHCMLTYVFKRLGHNEYQCIDIACSTPFMLYCRRRRRVVAQLSSATSESTKTNTTKKRKIAKCDASESPATLYQRITSIPKQVCESETVLDVTTNVPFDTNASLRKYQSAMKKHKAEIHSARLDHIVPGDIDSIFEQNNKSELNMNMAGKDEVDLFNIFDVGTDLLHDTLDEQVMYGYGFDDISTCSSAFTDDSFEYAPSFTQSLVH